MGIERVIGQEYESEGYIVFEELFLLNREYAIIKMYLLKNKIADTYHEMIKDLKYMELKPEELIKKLNDKQELPQLVVVFGDDDYYKNRIAAAVPEYVCSDTPEEDREITVFEKDTNVNALESTINSYPFFSGHSLVIIKDEKLFGKADEDGEGKNKQTEALQKLFADIPEYCTVLIVTKKLDKRTKLFKSLKSAGVVCECKSMKTYQLGPWLDAQAEQEGGRFDREALATIMEYLAPVEDAPLALLEQEIRKLAIYAGERTTWTRADVEAVFAELPEASGFAINNALAERNLPLVLELLAGERKKGTSLLPLCGMIMYQLRRMLRFLEMTRCRYDQKTIGSELKVPPFMYRRFAAQCSRFSEARLKQAVFDVAQVNIDLRKGGRGFASLEEAFIRLLG